MFLVSHESRNANALAAKAIGGLVKKLVMVGLLLFLPAGSWNYWQAWVFLPVFFIAELLVILHLLKSDPVLLQRRLKGGSAAEPRASQKLIIMLMALCFILLVLVPGLDHRFHWSHIPAWLVLTADAGVLLGFFIQFRVFQANSFAAIIIAIVPGQKVIATGPYAVVRHPMYAGGLLADFFIPIALGSWWGLPFAVAMLAAVSLRLRDEEKLLRQSLPGYEAYCQKVRFRLIPRVW
jgi:protein-S-isoprenylcysteine O-methyltransferase Ste14